ncbi:MAG TPA: sulfatase-like hydrolase/transferase [Vicinamibacteria bacterium]|nr:sulfatase-like hydrolase/transferase [Vicinamibacteria bacterium]
MPRRRRSRAGAAPTPPEVAAGPPPRLKPVAIVAVAALLAVVAGGAWLHVRSRPPRTAAEARARLAGRDPAPRDVNVLVVTLDTLRADKLGAYGAKDGSTPHLDALAAQGVVFENATATVPLTLPSHASIFTGLFPPRHGVRDNGGFFLGDEVTTLAERLRSAGWATGAFVSAWVLDSKWGLGQGFDHYSDRFELSKYKTLSLGTVQKRGDEVTADALRWLEGVKERRFFAWVHLYDPHTPYDPPEPYASRYPGRPYVGEIAFTDELVGRLTGWLRASGLDGRTVVVVLADHGESLGEHGEQTHAYFVYDSSMHVPLIVRTPWGDRGRVPGQVSTADVMPTVLDLAGLDPPADVDGRSRLSAILNPASHPGANAYLETYFPRYHFGWQHLRAVRNGQYKFIDAPEPELYDVKADPGETRNIYKAYSARAEDLRRWLVEVGTAAAVPEKRELDPETLQRLAALGYVGNADETPADAVLPDPKTKVHLYALMAAARAAAQDERLEQAIEKMRQVVAEDPGIVDAHLTLGNWLSRAARAEEAIAAYQQVLQRDPDNTIALVNVAHIHRQRGRVTAAVEGYRAALELDPKSPQTWYHLATLYLDTGRVADAEKTFHEALKHNEKMGAALNSLGAIAYARGNAAEAERLVKKALELEPEVRTGRFNLARLLEAKGQRAQAEALYKEELATYPDNGKAHFNLAQLYREAGDRARYLQALQSALEAAPEFGPPYFFLAREHLNEGRLDHAERLASEGLKVASGSPVAPLGHYVLADVYNRRGRAAAARDEVAKAQRLEAALRKNPVPPI